MAFYSFENDDIKIGVKGLITYINEKKINRMYGSAIKSFFVKRCNSKYLTIIIRNKSSVHNGLEMSSIPTDQVENLPKKSSTFGIKFYQPYFNER